MRRYVVPIVALLLVMATTAMAATPLTTAQVVLLNRMSPAAARVQLGTKLQEALVSAATTAAAVSVADGGGHYTAATVEAALTEIMVALKAETNGDAGADLVAATPIANIGTANTDTVQEILETIVGILESEVDSSSGADYIAATPIAGVGTASTDTVQEIAEWIAVRLQSVANGTSGADYLGTTAIAAFGAGETVQSILEGIDTALAATGANASGAEYIGSETISGWAGNDVQTVLESAKTYIDAKPYAPVYSMFFAGNLGHEAGVGADGVLIGDLTDNAVDSFLLGSHDATATCVTFNQPGTYADEATDVNNAAADDVETVPAAVDVGDILYVGHATIEYVRFDVQITTQGNFNGTVVWEYWDGDSWEAHANVTDGTSNLSAGAGWVSVTFDAPGDWELTTTHSINAYWTRGRVSVDNGGGGQLAGEINIILSESDTIWTDDTTDINSAGAGDVDLLAAYPTVNDAAYFGMDSAVWLKLKITVSQAMTVGAGVITVQYSTAGGWSTLTCEDNTATWLTGAATYIVSFAPPSDWATKVIDGNTEYWVRFRLTTEGVTQQPIATQAWIMDVDSGDGITISGTATLSQVQMTAQTASATNNDSEFLIINLTQGTYDGFTWTQADIMDIDATISLAITAADKIAVVQVGEDGTTEFANANLLIEVQ